MLRILIRRKRHGQICDGKYGNRAENCTMDAEQLLNQMGDDLDWWSDWYNYRDKDYGGWFRANFSWPTRGCYDNNNCIGLMTTKG